MSTSVPQWWRLLLAWSCKAECLGLFYVTPSHVLRSCPLAIPNATLMPKRTRRAQRRQSNPNRERRVVHRHESISRFGPQVKPLSIRHACWQFRKSRVIRRTDVSSNSSRGGGFGMFGPTLVKVLVRQSPYQGPIRPTRSNRNLDSCTPPRKQGAPSRSTAPHHAQCRPFSAR